MRLRRKRNDSRESKIALEQANKHLELIKAREPEVKEVARASRWIRVENHFSEMLLHIVEGKR